MRRPALQPQASEQYRRSRRRFLAGVTAGAIALSGCTALSSGTDRTATTDGDGTLTGDGYELRLGERSVTASIVSVTTSGTHLGVYDEPDTQFLVFEADRSDGGPLDETPLAVELDGARFTEFRYVERPETQSRARIAFPVPTRPYDGGRVVLGDRDSVSLTEGVVTALSKAPAFRVTSFVVPDHVNRGDTLHASFTVENRGDRDAGFRAEFGTRPPSDVDEVVVTVPAGESATHEGRFDPYYGEQADSVRVVLGWGLDRMEKQVPIHDESRTTTG